MSRLTAVPMALGLLMLAGCMAEPNAPAPAAPAQAEPAGAAAAEATAVTAPASPADGVAALSPAPIDIGAPAPAVSQACNLEATSVAADPAATPFEVKAGNVVTFDGWILAGDGLGAPGSVQLRIVSQAGDAAWTAPLALTVPRTDVPRAGADADGGVGFSQAVNLRDLPPGRHRLVLLAETGGNSVVCDNGRTLTVISG